MSEDIQKIDIASRTIFRTVLILIAFWFVYIIRDVLLLLFAAVIIAAAIEPVANRLQRRRIPRAATVALVYITVIAVVSLVISLLIPALTTQLAQLAQTLPAMVERLEQREVVAALIQQEAVVESLQQFLNRIGDGLTATGGTIVEQTRSLFSGLTSLLFVFIIAFYLVVERHALQKAFRMLVPKRHSAYVEQTLERVQAGIGRWVLAQLTLGVVVGLVVGLGLWLLGFKYALVLGLLAGIFEIIPVIGPIIAAVPGVVIGFSQSLWFGMVALVFYVVVQQLENHWLVPTVMRRATGLNPLVTIIAVLLGARLYGVIGVIVAVPIATIISIFWSDLFVTDPFDTGTTTAPSPLLNTRYVRAMLTRIGVLKQSRRRPLVQ